MGNSAVPSRLMPSRMARIFSPSVQAPMPVSRSLLILLAATRPGRPSSAGMTLPWPRPPSSTGPPKREKSRREWQPSQSARVNRYLPRAIRSGVMRTSIEEGFARAGFKTWKYAVSPAAAVTPTSPARIAVRRITFVNIWLFLQQAVSNCPRTATRIWRLEKLK